MSSIMPLLNTIAPCVTLSHECGRQPLLTIRPVTHHDILGLEVLYAQSIALNAKGFIQNLAFHGDIKDIASRMKNEGGEFVVGVLNNEVVAMGGLRLSNDGQCAELCKLHVNVNLQGKGYGRFLCEHLLERATEKGLTKVCLHVTTTQHAAIRLYKSLGFETNKTELRTIEYDNERMEFETAFMSKQLSH